MSGFSQGLTISPSQPLRTEALPSFLQKLITGNDLVMTFNVRNLERPSGKPDYFVFTRRGPTMRAYQTDGTQQELRSLDLPESSLTLIWKTILQNEMLTMRDEKDIPNFCAEKYRVFNNYSYDFMLISMGLIKTLSFVEPEYYDVACYGMAERQQVINMADAIRLALSVKPSDD